MDLNHVQRGIVCHLVQKQRPKFDCTGKAWILNASSTLHCVTGFKPHKKSLYIWRRKKCYILSHQFQWALERCIVVVCMSWTQLLMVVKRFLFGLWINLKYVDKRWIFSTYLNLFGKELLLYHRPCFHPGHKFWKISNKSSPKLILPV